MNISITEFEYNVMLDVYKKYPGLVKFSYIEEPDNEFDYHMLTSWAGEKAKDYAWIFFVLIVIRLILKHVQNSSYPV